MGLIEAVSATGSGFLDFYLGSPFFRRTGYLDELMKVQ